MNESRDEGGGPSEQSGPPPWRRAYWIMPLPAVLLAATALFVLFKPQCVPQRQDGGAEAPATDHAPRGVNAP